MTQKRLSKALVYYNEEYFMPIRFSYDGIKIFIKTITSNWIESAGRERIYHFSVLTNLGAYNLEFHEALKKWYCHPSESA
mgnify:FL=1